MVYTSLLRMPYTDGIDNVMIYWDDDDGEYKGFCVYNDRIAVFGYNGLCVKDVSGAGGW